MEHSLIVRCLSAGFFGFALGLVVLNIGNGSQEVQEPAVNMRGGYMQAFSAAKASPMSMSCPVPGKPMSVNAMQATLRKHGIPPSPMERAALAQWAATRDVSMAAQAKEEFSKLDPATQAKMTKMRDDIVVRAASMKPEDMAGVTAPLGFFDPAGFAKARDGDIAVYRRAELKHGRVCMLASLGIFVSEKFHPLFDKWGDGSFVSASASHFTSTAGEVFWPAFWIMTAGHELVTTFADYEGKDAADFGFDPLSLKPKDPKAFRELENKELNNGRLAMLAAAGMMAQELVTGKSIF